MTTHSQRQGSDRTSSKEEVTALSGSKMRLASGGGRRTKEGTQGVRKTRQTPSRDTRREQIAQGGRLRYKPVGGGLGWLCCLGNVCFVMGGGGMGVGLVV